MSSETSSPDLLSPHEIIFSCAICQRTITELYKRPRTDHGFSSGGHEERVVTRLWLAECGHLTCSDHLEGGGVPFYPQGKQPSAPCPYCVAEKEDATPRTLYFITGRGRDEHDKNIPKEYFHIPPSILNDPNGSASALRFQYLSLLRFGGMMAKRCKQAERAAEVAEAKVQDLTTTLQDTRKETADLKRKVDELRGFEKKYASFKKREPELRHHLGNFAALANENSQMRRQLRQLGYDVPRTKYSMDAEKPNGPNAQQQQNSSSSGTKRPREVFLEDTVDEPNGNHFDAYESMPPPPKPQHRQKQAVEVYSGDKWRTGHTSDEGLAPPVQPPQRAQKQYMMNGALPPQSRQTMRPTPGPRRDPQDVRSDNMEELLAFALPQRGRTEHRYANDQRLYHDSPMENTAPSSDDAMMPQMRQGLPFAAPPNHPQDGQPNFGQTERTHLSRSRLLSRDLRAQAPAPSVDHGRSRTTSSPFFYDAVQTPAKAFQPHMVIQSTLPHQVERLLPEPDAVRMDVDMDTTPKSQSLNDLSFIQQPYTRSNKPVYSRPASRTVWSCAAPSAPAQQQYVMPLVPNRSYLPDVGPPAPRAPMAPPPVPASRQIQSRNPGIHREGGFQRFAKSSVTSKPAYGMSSNAPRFPQRSGVSTGDVRRSVRR